jgi:hypothetical protein
MVNIAASIMRMDLFFPLTRLAASQIFQSQTIIGAVYQAGTLYQKAVPTVASALMNVATPR